MLMQAEPIYEAYKSVCAEGETPIDLALCLREGRTRFAPAPGEAVGFAFPVYYGGLPSVVAEFLRRKGFAVDRDVGRSSFKIDVAVRDAKDPSRYVAGIECDGEAYAAQPTAQDRDLNRTGVLRGLGWRMIRVWSADWALDRARAEERLLDELENARAGIDAPVYDPWKDPDVTAVAKPPEDAAKSEYRTWSSKTPRDKARFADQASRARLEKDARSVVKAEGPVCEAVLTGAGSSATLLMIYTRSDYRRQGMAKNLIGAASALLRERGVNTMYTHIFRRNVPQVALMRRLNGAFVRKVTALPGIDL